jgi:hypothetical protein
VILLVSCIISDTMGLNMFKVSSPKRAEIDEHTAKLIVGVIAISLASLTSYFSKEPLQSISASYHAGGWARDIFVGFLFAIFAFLVAYNGKSITEKVLSKIAAVAALGVAVFPCKCESNVDVIPYAHGTFAAVMFTILAFFCYIFFRRAWSKNHAYARSRAYIYAICGITIASSIMFIAVDNFSGGVISERINRLTFYGENAGLIAFGIAWLTASRTLPLITRKGSDDRFSIFRGNTSERSIEPT